jgi:RNA-binding protein
MLTSRQRAQFRAQANTLDTTLIVGKGGVTEAVVAEADNQLLARELVKGKVLEGALLSPREASDAICEATGADGVAVIGTKFVIYRFSEKLQEQRNQTGRAKRKTVSVAKSNPVRKGAQARREAAKQQRQQRNEYFRQQAIEKAIERDRERQLRNKEQD